MSEPARPPPRGPYSNSGPASPEPPIISQLFPRAPARPPSPGSDSGRSDVSRDASPPPDVSYRVASPPGPHHHSHTPPQWEPPRRTAPARPDNERAIQRSGTIRSHSPASPSEACRNPINKPYYQTTPRHMFGGGPSDPSYKPPSKRPARDPREYPNDSCSNGSPTMGYDENLDIKAAREARRAERRARQSRVKGTSADSAGPFSSLPDKLLEVVGSPSGRRRGRRRGGRRVRAKEERARQRASTPDGRTRPTEQSPARGSKRGRRGGSRDPKPRARMVSRERLQGKNRGADRTTRKPTKARSRSMEPTRSRGQGAVSARVIHTVSKAFGFGQGTKGKTGFCQPIDEKEIRKDVEAMRAKFPALFQPKFKLVPEPLEGEEMERVFDPVQMKLVKQPRRSRSREPSPRLQAGISPDRAPQRAPRMITNGQAGGHTPPRRRPAFGSQRRKPSREAQRRINLSANPYFNATTHQLKHMLKSLGLGQYEQSLVRDGLNKIDDFKGLTKPDLEQMTKNAGMVIVHRRKFMNAVLPLTTNDEDGMTSRRWRCPPRTMLNPQRYSGHVISWFVEKNFGWIRPDADMSRLHPSSHTGGPKPERFAPLYAHRTDIRAIDCTHKNLIPGMAVEFNVYVDTKGLGATEITGAGGKLISVPAHATVTGVMPGRSDISQIITPHGPMLQGPNLQLLKLQELIQWQIANQTAIMQSNTLIAQQQQQQSFTNTQNRNIPVPQAPANTMAPPAASPRPTHAPAAGPSPPGNKAAGGRFVRRTDVARLLLRVDADVTKGEEVRKDRIALKGPPPGIRILSRPPTKPVPGIPRAKPAPNIQPPRRQPRRGRLRPSGSIPSSPPSKPQLPAIFITRDGRVLTKGGNYNSKKTSNPDPSPSPTANRRVRRVSLSRTSTISVSPSGCVSIEQKEEVQVDTTTMNANAPSFTPADGGGSTMSMSSSVQSSTVETLPTKEPLKRAQSDPSQPARPTGVTYRSVGGGAQMSWEQRRRVLANSKQHFV